LEDLLRHGDPQVRIQAVWTLGQVREDVVIPALRLAVLDTARPVRFQAAWALATRLVENGGKRKDEGWLMRGFRPSH
jgi:HEAT repeat protein